MNEWILVANASLAFIFNSNNLRTKDLQLLKELQHLKSREKGTELTTDRPGLYQGERSTRSAYEKMNPRDAEAEHFAKELAVEIKAAIDSNNYDRFVLVVASHFYGLIKKHVNCDMAHFVHISKDYTKLTQRELLAQLRKQLFE